MIEIIYDDQGVKTKNVNRAKYDLPKNIRQVGNAPGNYRIYVEDYVMTYLRKIAAPGNTTCRGAILLGEVYDEDDGRVLFISGAVEAQNLEFDISMIKFGDAVWSGLYSDINKYFDNLSIVGWFLSRMGFSTTINDQMKKLHRENFPGDEKVLFLMDSLECEETFYYYDHGNLVKEKGYYIYYVRNEKMQNYIISRKNAGNESKNDNVVLNDRIVVENFREKRRKSSAREKGHGWTTAACFACVCVLSLGALWYVSPETVDKLGQKLDIGKDSGEVQVFMNSDDIENGENDKNVEQNSTENFPLNNTENTASQGVDIAADNQGTQQMTTAAEITAAETTATETTVAETTTAETLSADGYSSVNDSTADKVMTTYEVEAGDTLVSISIKMYSSQNYADKIAAANGIDMDDPIYEGQKLIIPYVE